MKTSDFKYQGHLPNLFKNTPRSKALEPVCLSRSPISAIVTQVPGREKIQTNLFLFKPQI
jgi:hypothetical protein